MKAIVIRQPWATLVAIGAKTIETRPWPPNGPMRPEGVRGLPGCSLERGERIAIVAGAQVPKDAQTHGDWTVWRWGDGAKMDRRGVHEVTGDEIDLPLGAVVCTVAVDDALPIVAPMIDPPDDHLVPTADGHLMWWKFTPVLGQRRWSAASRHPMLNERTVVGGRRDPDLDPQLPLGDFTPGRWGWLLSDPRLPMRREVCDECRGHGFYTDDADGEVGATCELCSGLGGWNALADPVPCKGRRGVFTLPDDVTKRIGGGR